MTTATFPLKRPISELVLCTPLLKISETRVTGLVRNMNMRIDSKVQLPIVIKLYAVADTVKGTQVYVALLISCRHTTAHRPSLMTP